MSSQYRAGAIIIAPYKESIIYIADSTRLALTERFELGTSYLGGDIRRYILGYP